MHVNRVSGKSLTADQTKDLTRKLREVVFDFMGAEVL